MFVSHEVTVDAGFEVARVRLIRLIEGGVLYGASDTAYQEGREVLIRVGPFGDGPGISKLVRVRALDPVRRGGTATISLRWEATGLAGEMFPVLDADLMLIRRDEDRSGLSLVGSYRPPLGRMGALLDAAIMHRVADATVRSLLDGLATALGDAATSPSPDGEPAWPWYPASEPDQC